MTRHRLVCPYVTFGLPYSSWYTRALHGMRLQLQVYHYPLTPNPAAHYTLHAACTRGAVGHRVDGCIHPKVHDVLHHAIGVGG